MLLYTYLKNAVATCRFEPSARGVHHSSQGPYIPLFEHAGTGVSCACACRYSRVRDSPLWAWWMWTSRLRCLPVYVVPPHPCAGFVANWSYYYDKPLDATQAAAQVNTLEKHAAPETAEILNISHFTLHTSPFTHPMQRLACTTCHVAQGNASSGVQLTEADEAAASELRTLPPFDTSAVNEGTRVTIVAQERSIYEQCTSRGLALDSPGFDLI